MPEVCSVFFLKEAGVITCFLMAFKKAQKYYTIIE